MADDGLLVNFAIPSGTLAPKQTIKGGPWHERQRIRRIQKYVEKKSAPKPDGPGAQQQAAEQSMSGEGTRESKRQRVEHTVVESRPDFRTRYKPPVDGGTERDFVSSLFTKNPASRIVFDDTPSNPVPEEPIKPSNAPLTEKELNFTTLGLSPAIATHLTNKLSISAPTAIQKAAIPPLINTDDDAFIQAETGSGKTLAYLLPLVQRIMSLAKENEVDGKNIQRDSGLFAIILAPTRELSKQIVAVLESLLRCAHWIVAGIVTGGEKKKSEKARLRKGLNILVATPGRLADHLAHTEALDTSAVRWLILDEGDRLMELGFEDDIKQIVNRLDYRLRRSEGQVLDSLPKRRVTILCSATMRADVQKLGDLSLKDAVHIKGQEPEKGEAKDEGGDEKTKEKKFAVPAQLKQTYVTVPAKLRLVTLLATLKRSFVRCKPTAKVMVFLSCADSVDFHFQALTRIEGEETSVEKAAKAEAKEAKNRKKGKDTPKPVVEVKTEAKSSSLSTTEQEVKVFRLHGSLQQAVRTSTLKSFANCETPAVLVCTDIASRGLDLPMVDHVIECDPAFSREEHIHRVGRTARAGRDGSATIFLMPGCEEGYVEVLKSERDEIGATNLRAVTAEYVLKAGFPATTSQSKRKANEMEQWEQLATDFQMSIERWALADPVVLEAARRAYQSHIRAYTTHTKDERQWFDIKQLHLGHLAKAFALRDRPGNVNVPGMRADAAKVKADRKKAGAGARRTGGGSDVEDNANEVDMREARRKMQMMSKAMAGAGEFNLG
jgi:ATP-dependent RNA helicase DDX31/DBP7